MNKDRLYQLLFAGLIVWCLYLTNRIIVLEEWVDVYRQLFEAQVQIK